MKNIILISFLLFFGLIANAQQNNSLEESQSYIVLTRNIQQLKPILITAEKLQKDNNTSFKNYEVVICGKTVKELVNRYKIISFIKEAQRLGVKIHACGFSLKKFNVNKTQLPKELNVVENGILYNFQRQQEGYLSIEL